MKIIITEDIIDPWSLIKNYETEYLSTNSKFGATNIFIGTMRDINESLAIKEMFLEHYPGMTEKMLNATVNKAIKDYQLFDALVIHRVGSIHPDDTIVVVCVWSSHRKEAFESCRYIMEELKSNAPFWKQETLTNNKKRWVRHNSKGY